MALQHAQPLQPIDLAVALDPNASGLSHSLLKTEQLQLIKLVLPRGQVMPQHQVPGEITIQCLLGEVEITTPQRGCLLRVGELVLLPGGEPHALLAMQAAKLLLTLLFAPPR